MAEFDAPIARSEDLTEFGDFQASDTSENNAAASVSDGEVHLNGGSKDDDAVDRNYADMFSGSLEDLVNTFDEKIISCFRNYDTEVADIAAPAVQILSQEQMLNQSPTWRMLSQNFGNVLPVDWNTSHARSLQLAVLNLPNDPNAVKHSSNDLSDGDVDDEELAKDLDLHSLILNSQNHEPVVSAEEVLQEIDDIMRDQLTSGLGSSVSTTNESSPCVDLPALMSAEANALSPLTLSGHRQRLSVTHLNEVIIELERMIQSQSEVLINELAFRDELEFEKELKNNFISLILVTQNKRRQLSLDRKKGPAGGISGSSSLGSVKYLTTIIPYNPESGPPDVRAMQVLIKILKAMNDDSPAVPALLTDYILKVLCPK